MKNIEKEHLAEELEKLISENNDLREKYFDLLKENEEIKRDLNFKYLSVLDGQEVLDKYCDFDILIKTLKKQDIKIKELKELLERALKFYELMETEGVPIDEENSLISDIKKVLESKNEKI